MNIRKLLTVLIVLILVIAVCYFTMPKFRANVFVSCYHDWMETSIHAGGGVPANDALFFDYKSVNVWEGAHPMMEFILSSWGNSYWGCYYSADDVPLAFQNTDAELTQTGHNAWKWQAEGDNHGITSKIMDHWYYFEATF